MSNSSKSKSVKNSSVALSKSGSETNNNNKQRMPNASLSLLDHELQSQLSSNTRKTKHGTIHSNLNLQYNSNSIFDTNALILPANNKKDKNKLNQIKQTQEKPISKKLQKKLEKIAKEKEKKANKIKYLSMINSNQLTEGEAKLLHSTNEISQHPTRLQELQRAFLENKAGIKQSNPNVQLFKPASSASDSNELTQIQLKMAEKTKKRQNQTGENTTTNRPKNSVSLNSFGLPDRAWIRESAPIGGIQFDTDRNISYGDDSEENSNEDEDENSENQSEDEINGNEQEDMEQEDEENKSDSEMIDGEPESPKPGLFTVAFPVIQASKRAKRKRIVLTLPGQEQKLDNENIKKQKQEIEEQVENEQTDGESEQEVEDEVKMAVNDNDEQNEIEQPSADALDDDYENSSNEQSDDEKGENSDSMSDSETIDEKPRKPSISINPEHKPRLQPSDKAFRQQRLQLGIIPLDKRSYQIKDEEIIVTKNAELAGIDSKIVQADVKGEKWKKGQIILELKNDQEWDSRPFLVTRTENKSFAVYLNRKPAIQKQRLTLPLMEKETEIIECFSAHNVIILKGETGSGKSTQIPQLLLEYGYSFPERYPGLIGVTEPRRVAAVSTAKRVAEELNIPNTGDNNKTAVKSKYKLGPISNSEFDGRGLCISHDPQNVVGYQIRYDSTTCTANTRIKYMTDGILLKEVQSDALLLKYSVICIDEAHERGINTDVLIGLLSLIVKRRLIESERPNSTIKPLKLIIMSATLELDDFLSNPNLFATPPPVIDINARKYPVEERFARKTELENYLQIALKKVCAIHSQLDDGTILVFLTGKEEIGIR